MIILILAVFEENRLKNSRVERSRETVIKILQEMRDDASWAGIVEAEI